MGEDSLRSEGVSLGPQGGGSCKGGAARRGETGGGAGWQPLAIQTDERRDGDGNTPRTPGGGWRSDREPRERAACGLQKWPMAGSLRGELRREEREARSGGAVDLRFSWLARRHPRRKMSREWAWCLDAERRRNGKETR